MSGHSLPTLRAARRGTAAGFTLVELLTVIVIIAILVGVGQETSFATISLLR